MASMTDRQGKTFAWTLSILLVGVITFLYLGPKTVSYTHLRAHETVLDLVCRLLLEKKKNTL